MKKYMSIVRHGKSGTHLTLENDAQIVIMEKLDGANSSFKLEDGKIVCFSRNNQLDEHNTLRGFYGWVQQNIKPEDLLEGVIYYGEWLSKHNLDYGENANQFYLFDVYNMHLEEYVSFSMVKDESRRLDLNLIPVFYEGPFQSLEHIQQFVGTSKLGEVGEGVVVKNTQFKNKHGEQKFTKFVSDAFAEVMKVKPQKVQAEPLMQFLNNTVTKARINKLIHKLVDDGILDEGYSVRDMGIIMKNLGTQVFDDIMKEEQDQLMKMVKARIGKKLPVVVKEILAEENRV